MSKKKFTNGKIESKSYAGIKIAVENDMTLGVFSEEEAKRVKTIAKNFSNKELKVNVIKE